jgi:hypothetical protein
MTDQGDSLLREVDQAMRDDRMAALWQQYRRPILVAMVAIIFGTIGNAKLRDYRETRAGEAMQQLSAARQLFSQKKFDEAAPAFAIIAHHHKGDELGDMANLWQARSLLAANKKSQAITVLSSLAEHPQSRNHVWRDTACLRLVALDATQAKCLTAEDASPLAAQRTITRAALLWNEEKTSEAQALLEGLINHTKTPASVRDNAKRYLSVIAPTKAANASVKKGS